jgi:hypothetical protein
MVFWLAVQYAQLISTVLNKETQVGLDKDDEWMSSNDAAEYIDYAPYTLRRSRQTGRLDGRAAPGYRKNGTAVEYNKLVLDKWLGDAEVFDYEFS